ncbi:hypothetical protein L4C36_14970 [Photobacterium japonica]|uniref:hypothetical protein n=1 Tax=Photobacterium japonica TaxID=2910235 RepID=UPI003D14E28E
MSKTIVGTVVGVWMAMVLSAPVHAQADRGWQHDLDTQMQMQKVEAISTITAELEGQIASTVTQANVSTLEDMTQRQAIQLADTQPVHSGATEMMDTDDHPEVIASVRREAEQ